MRDRCRVAGIVALLAAAACADDESEEIPPTLESCAAGWQVLTPWSETLESGTLVLGAGHLFFVAFDPPSDAIRSLPVSGGETAEVARASTREMWLEGSELLLARTGSLRSVPIGGG